MEDTFIGRFIIVSKENHNEFMKGIGMKFHKLNNLHLRTVVCYGCNAVKRIIFCTLNNYTCICMKFFFLSLLF